MTIGHQMHPMPRRLSGGFEKEAPPWALMHSFPASRMAYKATAEKQRGGRGDAGNAETEIKKGETQRWR